jgi:hypothetical protein
MNGIGSLKSSIEYKLKTAEVQSYKPMVDGGYQGKIDELHEDLGLSEKVKW